MNYLQTEIRDMTENDLPAVMEIENLCFKAPWKKEDLLYEIKENPVSNVWVIELSNASMGLKHVCGFVNYWNTFDNGTICQIAVHPELQHYGLGSQLMKEVVKDAKIKKVRTLTLEVRANNKTAIDFYLKHCFKISHIKEGYYSNGENAVYMILEVNDYVFDSSN